MSDSHVADHIRSVFGAAESLYDILGVSSTATEKEISSAYRKMALKHHPDRGGDAEKVLNFCNEIFVTTIYVQFKALCAVHAILSDEEKRKIYDDCGSIDDNDMGDANTEDFWYEYFRNLYPKFGTSDIDNFAEKYKGSEEEREDTLNSYIQYDGHMKHIFDSVPLCETGEDEERIQNIILDAIATGEVDKLSRFKPKKSFSRKKAKKSINDDASLIALIQNRNRGDNRMGSIVSKHAAKHNIRFDDIPDIPDDEWEAIQKRILKK